MRKKIIRFAVVFCLAVIMIAGNMGTVASAKTNKKAAKTTIKTEADGQVTQDDFAVSVNGVKISMGDDINSIIKQLGEPSGYQQARSCLYDGDDKIYEYGGITIYTYPSGKKDIVYIVEFNGEETTLSGIHVGSTKQEVIAAYGMDYTENVPYLTYEFGENATITFQMNNDKVLYIEIYSE